MKRFLILVAAASLALPALAVAQTPPQKQQHTPAAKPAPRPAARPAARPQRPAATRPAARPTRPAANRPQPPRGNQAFHRGQTITRVHGPAFVYPHGWHYRHWSVGGILPRLFLAETYWYADWGALGLQAPPPGYEWVRFGPDLILVNLTTGAIEDVIYGAFY